MASILPVNVPLVARVVGHVLTEVPNTDGVVRGTRDEGSGRENGFEAGRVILLRGQGGVDVQAPDTRGMEEERM